MTLDESLNNIAAISEILVEVSKSHIMANEAINEIRGLDIGEIYFTLRQALNELEALKKPPTVDEVCKALSDFYEVNIIHEHYQKGIDVNVYTIDAFYYRETNYDIDNKPYTRRRDVVAGDKERIALDVYLPPHIITLIGRFYEGLEVKE